MSADDLLYEPVGSDDLFEHLRRDYIKYLEETFGDDMSLEQIQDMARKIRESNTTAINLYRLYHEGTKNER